MGGVEGVWVQRAAGKSDCGEGGGGEVVFDREVEGDIERDGLEGLVVEVTSSAAGCTR